MARLPGAAALACVVPRGMGPLPMMLLGSVSLVIGTLVTLPALLLPSTALLPVGTLVAGFGFGTAFFGGFRMLAHTAVHEKRAQLFSAVYVVCYLANSVPAIIAGLIIPRAGLRDAALGYVAVVTALALLSIPLGVSALRRTRAAAAPTATPPALVQTAGTRH
ncbi:hypothetical protein [Streptomyces sp. VRA16 Mangrove soil]|uniref:hypothetical protein n=1 Tax=Streptomyces sp. VRA16 Mangrove soil TaxID=2817434 RepID=UPI001A9F195E|nr:hypothetical protein [Streptomyces sp. VRA16 Mangrove soil]MBO1334375.1 hypothetical protein [Streptomyces sp. VRA16 Mangrove soil]